MLDVAPTELLLVAVVALLVIGPKDLPRAMRFVGKWVGKARGVARQFRSGIDTMIRESELAEMEKQWAAENERIMREHPTPSLPAPQPDHFTHDSSTVDEAPVMVEQPALFPDATQEAAPEKPKRVRKPRAAVPETPQTPDEPQS
jgi:sec-independent protein translocase protein TatB